MTSPFPERYFHTRHKYPPPTIKTTFPFTSSRTFTNFSKLPTELRLKIWRHCFPKPRTIVILQKLSGFDDDHQRIIRYECFKPHPTILAVNRESRNEALKFYVMIHGPHKFCVAFDNERDTIYGMTPPSEYIHGDLSIKVFEEPLFEYLSIGREHHAGLHNAVRIKSLAVNEADLKNSGMARQYLQLDELFIVLPSSLGFRRSDIGGSAQVPPITLGGRPHPEIGEVQQKFLKELEKYAKKESTTGENKTKEVKRLVVKVVQWGTLRTEEDFFCVPLTPLSLRKDDL